MHGIGGGSEGRIYIPQAMQALGLKTAESLQHAAAQITRFGFAFIPLHALNNDLDQLLKLKSLLGLRSPINTVIRMLNPLRAPASFMGIFHPGYDVTHQQAATLLGDNRLAVFKGEGGEAERNPDAPCKVKMVIEGIMQEEEWPALSESKHLKDATLDVSRLDKLWRNEINDEYGKFSVLGTTAIALRTMGTAKNLASAESQAVELWETRNIHYFNKLKE
jgi:anthranilate phosphoribosyltransferase